MFIKVRKSQDPYGHGVYAISKHMDKDGHLTLVHPAKNVPKSGFKVHDKHTYKDIDILRMNAEYLRKKKS